MDEYTGRWTPSHFSHPHRQLRTYAQASTYMHASDVLSRTYSFKAPKFKHRSNKLKVNARNKKLELRS